MAPLGWKGDTLKRLPSLLLLLLAVGCGATLPQADRDLFAAIKADDAPQVQRSLVSGANINVARDSYYDGLSPLGWASASGSTKAAELLIARGADVNGVSKGGVTPLHVAALTEHPAVTTLLIRHGANVNAPTDGGWTPLYKAMEQLASAPATTTPPAAEVASVVSIVTSLLASGAQVNVQSPVGGMPIHMAALTGQKTLVQMLLDKGADVDARSTDGMTPLYQAARKDAAEVAELLIARGADVNARTKSGNTALMISADQGSAQVAKLLLGHGADVNARDKEGFPPLLWACRSFLVVYTLEASTPGARDELRKISGAVSAAEMTETRKAARQVKGNFGAVAMLLVNGGADPNVAAPAFTSLGAAAVVGDKALAEALIAHGAMIDATTGGESPLHAAIAEAHGDVAALIIDKGANVNARNMSQLTPLHFLGVYMHDRKLADLLIQHGADVNAKDQSGHTALEGAIRAGNNEVAEVLRQHGAK